MKKIQKQNIRCLVGSKIHKDGLQKLFNAWTKPHFSNFKMG